MKVENGIRSGHKACICCNGEIKDMDRARQLASSVDLLIAADGGIRYLAGMGLKPDVVIGDMDSVSENQLNEVEETGRITFPRDKDRSDTELAVQWAIEQGAERILLLGAWGGRADHTIGNMALLMRFPGVLELWDEGFLVLALTAGQHLTIHTSAGAHVSMFSFDENLRVKTTGLKYNLNNEHLKYATHGLSNAAVSDACSVAVTRGMIILCTQGGETWLQR